MRLPTPDEMVLPEHRSQVAAARAYERAACQLARAQAELEAAEAELEKSRAKAQEARQALEAIDKQVVTAWRASRDRRAATAPAATTPPPTPKTQETP